MTSDPKNVQPYYNESKFSRVFLISFILAGLQIEVIRGLLGISLVRAASFWRFVFINRKRAVATPPF